MLLNERYVLKDSAQLCDYYAAPHPGVLHKQIDHVDDYARRLIALSPFIVLGTQGPCGFDCSPKGGEPGFVQVEKAKTLLLPDRGGNNRLDGLTNLLHNPAVRLLFLIPGWSECFRLNGRAQISVDPELYAHFAQNSVPAKSVPVIWVDEAFIHCGRAIGFAGLWESSNKLDAAQLPKALDIFKAYVALHKAAHHRGHAARSARLRRRTGYASVSICQSLNSPHPPISHPISPLSINSDYPFIP